MTDKPELKKAILKCCLDNLKEPKIAEWFKQKALSLNSAASFFLAFGMVNRKVEKSNVEVNQELEERLTKISPLFAHQKWTLDDFCRLALLLHLDPKNNKDTIITMLHSADMNEQVAIYSSLPFLENAEAFCNAVVDGLRTNMIDVFDSISSGNIYPVKYFSEEAWNQMVLKAIFMERPIYRIYGIEKRNNPNLARILLDYVHERWAASRVVNPELWRMICGFLNKDNFDDIKKLIASTDQPMSMVTGPRVIVDSDFQEAKDWMLEQNIKMPNLTWDEIGEEIWEKEK